LTRKALPTQEMMKFLVILAICVATVRSAYHSVLREKLMGCFKTHASNVERMMDVVEANDLFSEEASARASVAFFLIGTEDSHIDDIPRLAAPSLASGSGTKKPIRIDMDKLQSQREVKDALIQHQRNVNGRQVYVIENLQNVKGSAAPLNAFLGPLNKEHSVLRDGVETVDFARAVFFFMYRMGAKDAGALPANAPSSALNNFVIQRYGFDRTTFTPEAFVGRQSLLLYFSGAESGYECDLSWADGFEGGESSYATILGLCAVGLVGLAGLMLRGGGGRAKSQPKRKTHRKKHAERCEEEDENAGDFRSAQGARVR